MSYSIDLRIKVLGYIKQNKSSIREASEIFGVHANTIGKWLKLEKRGTLRDPKPKRPWKKIDPKLLMEAVNQHPDWTLSNFAALFKVTSVAICLAFKTLKITRKKRVIYTENEMKRHVKRFWKTSAVTLKRSSCI